jgi:hypothetical protein
MFMIENEVLILELVLNLLIFVQFVVVRKLEDLYQLFCNNVKTMLLMFPTHLEFIHSSSRFSSKISAVFCFYFNEEAIT